MTGSEGRIVVPWYSESEWILVRDDILSSSYSRWKTARDRMYCWKARVDRLPAGVETTLSILDGKLSLNQDDPSISLTFAAAINRFLNHLSHIGKNLYGCYKFDEAARKFAIPDWLIDLRHETTHGHMMTLDSLRTGLDFCFDWICLNYWSPNEFETEVEPDLEQPATVVTKTSNNEIYEGISQILECYFYLRIYSRWGTKKVKDLTDQPELFEHLCDLWSKAVLYSKDSTKAKRKFMGSFNDLYINEGVSHLMRIIMGIDDEDLDTFINVLFEEELFFPQEEILISLYEKQPDNANIHSNKLPFNLIYAWKEVVKYLNSKSYISKILYKFLGIVKNTSEFKTRRSLSGEWIINIARTLTSSPDKDNGLQGTEDLNDFVLECILSPSEYSKSILQSVLPLREPRLPEEKEKKIIELCRAYNDASVCPGEDYVPKSFIEEEGKSSIKSCNDINWEDIPFGYIFGAEIEVKLSEDALSKLRSPLFNKSNYPPSSIYEIKKINWKDGNNDAY